jgi:hypothetical protein
VESGLTDIVTSYVLHILLDGLQLNNVLKGRRHCSSGSLHRQQNGGSGNQATVGWFIAP